MDPTDSYMINLCLELLTDLASWLQTISMTDDDFGDSF